MTAHHLRIISALKFDLIVKKMIYVIEILKKERLWFKNYYAPTPFMWFSLSFSELLRVSRNEFKVVCKFLMSK